MSESTQFRSYNSPGGAMTFGVSYLLDQQSGVFRPLYNTDLGGGGGGGGGTVSGALAITGVVQTTVGVPSSDVPPTITTITSSFSRPNNITTYQMGQLVTNSTTNTTLNILPGAAFSSGRGGIIQNLVLSKTGTNITNAAFNIMFYNSSGITIPGQDGQFGTGIYANSPYFLGTLVLQPMSTGYGVGSIGRAQLQQVSFAYNSLDENGNIYWLLEAAGNYTPASEEEFTLNATVVRD